MFSEESKNQIIEYVQKHFSIDSITVRLVSNAIDYAEKLNVNARQAFLKDLLDGIGFDDDELAAFAVGKIPQRDMCPELIKSLTDRMIF